MDTLVKTNTEIMQEAYANFKNGDIQGILEKLTHDVKWISGGYPEIPWGAPREGHAGVADYFQTLSETVEMTKFEPKEYITGNDKLIVLGHAEGKARNTEKTFNNDWVHVVTFKNGRVCRFENYQDTLEVAKALKS